jgi:hypothetical protein
MLPFFGDCGFVQGVFDVPVYMPGKHIHMLQRESIEMMAEQVNFRYQLYDSADGERRSVEGRLNITLKLISWARFSNSFNQCS